MYTTWQTHDKINGEHGQTHFFKHHLRNMYPQPNYDLADQTGPWGTRHLLSGVDVPDWQSFFFFPDGLNRRELMINGQLQFPMYCFFDGTWQFYCSIKGTWNTWWSIFMVPYPTHIRYQENNYSIFSLMGLLYGSTIKTYSHEHSDAQYMNIM